MTDIAALNAPYTGHTVHLEAFLPEEDGHRVFYRVVGKADGKPVLFLHGGPGGGTSMTDARYFDPAVYMVVLIDQRGAGLSTPSAGLEQNTTWKLVSDCERVRLALGVDTWHTVFGGSWGSTLALSYACVHPDRIRHGLVLRGIFTLRRSELVFFYQTGYGASHLFPEAFEEYRTAIPEFEQGDLMSAFYRRLTCDDLAVRAAAAAAWTRWEMATSRLVVDPDLIRRGEDPVFAEKFARIESHYFVHGGFFEKDGWLLERAGAVLPGAAFKVFIVQGRYDVVCPATTAYELKKRVPSAEFAVVTTGHSASEPPIMSQLIGWMNDLRSL
eukprot:c10394_g1_i1.p1 GENE.c10394_g1_i1~~c10394_g1_i1.p1  ORF type:complete len:338 (+),score=58.37 c10394_g1_i1:33-1016(+)